jgi:hypothetical protein
MAIMSAIKSSTVSNDRRSENIFADPEEAENLLNPARYLGLLFSYSKQDDSERPCRRVSLGVPVHPQILFRMETGRSFVRLWRKGLAEYDEIEGIAWSWQSIDGAMVKAPLALEAVGANPTDRGKMGLGEVFSSTGMESRCR